MSSVGRVVGETGSVGTEAKIGNFELDTPSSSLLYLDLVLTSIRSDSKETSYSLSTHPIYETYIQNGPLGNYQDLCFQSCWTVEPRCQEVIGVDGSKTDQFMCFSGCHYYPRGIGYRQSCRT
jgi:hypothetical protein